MPRGLRVGRDAHSLAGPRAGPGRAAGFLIGSGGWAPGPGRVVGFLIGPGGFEVGVRVGRLPRPTAATGCPGAAGAPQRRSSALKMAAYAAAPPEHPHSGDVLVSFSTDDLFQTPRDAQITLHWDEKSRAVDAVRFLAFAESAADGYTECSYPLLAQTLSIRFSRHNLHVFFRAEMISQVSEDQSIFWFPPYDSQRHLESVHTRFARLVTRAVAKFMTPTCEPDCWAEYAPHM